MAGVKVLYFASLRELLDQSGAEIDAVDCMTVAQLWLALNPSVAVPENCLVAINQNYAEWNAVVSDGDEVAFFPPVTGG